MTPTKTKLRKRKPRVSGKTSQTVSEDASPDSKCPICLDRFNDMAYLDRCLHKFCFRCIHEWAKYKAECPLCKQSFNSIFHSGKAENDFKEFVLRPMENNDPGHPRGHRFSYRSPLTSPPPDAGVMFEGLTGGAPPPQQDRGIRRMMMRLAARRRAQNEGRAVRRLREQEMIAFRQALYRAGVRVRSVRDGGRHREISAEFFQTNPACLHRLVPWLKRELTVLYGAHGSLISIVLHVIMSRIARYNMEDRAVRDKLRPFLLARTDHFLHEFISFARAPFSMEAYDEHAVYDCPAPSSEDGSSSEFSVIAISDNSLELDQPSVAADQTPWDDETPGPSYSTAEQSEPLSLFVSESESEISIEEGGESRDVQQSTSENNNPVTKEYESASPGEEDCVIVGYVKPMAERTPELVQLSSDSEESVLDENIEVPQQPQCIRFPSLSPPSSTCSTVYKHRSHQGQEQPPERPLGKDKPQASSGTKERRTPSLRGSPPADGHRGKHRRGRRAHSEGHGRRRSRSCERLRSGSKERYLQRSRRWSRSTERSWSARSPSRSADSDCTLSSRSRSGDPPPSINRTRKSRGRDVLRSRPTDAQWKPYRQSSQEKEESSHEAWNCTLYTGYNWDGCRPLFRSLSCPRESTSHRSRHEKPGGKRKYKTRHLEGSSEERPSKSHAAPSSSSCPKAMRRSDGRHGGPPQEPPGERSRSPSVEIVYEGRATGASRRHRRTTRRQKRKSRRHRSRQAPTVITIDSNSGSDTEVSTAADIPADARLLESLLQDWEQQILPLCQDNSLDILSTDVAPTAVAFNSDKWNVPTTES